MIELSRKRKLLFGVISVLLAVIVLEVGLFVVYAALRGRAFPFGWYDEAIQQAAADREPAQEVVHPYLGYVLHPEANPGTSYLGFPQQGDDLLQQKTDATVRIAIFGGSFAASTSISGEKTIRSILGSHGIQAEALTAAIGGYKQPQQLMALAYLLSHGADFDVVVNIDGFNEVALPQAEHTPKGINPSYPRSWYQLTLGLNDRDSLVRIGRLSYLKERRRHWAAVFQEIPKYSITRNVIWRFYDKRLERQTLAIHQALHHAQPDPERRFLVRGPDVGRTREMDGYQAIAEHWRACSLMMKALCDAHGIVYLHLLQPNQYFEAGKVLTEEERQIAFREDNLYRPGVVAGYPRLLAAKNELLAAGVDFHDLTLIYRDVGETIYADDCCHPNLLGYDLVAEYVARRIVEALNAGSGG